MHQTKTTRAFRTISEAGEELGLQPHVLRFWESKFSDIKPIKRGGGRRFYRPDDIEFIRGIKKLLHDEKHPIKDVQKLIKKKGPSRIVELGRSLEKAAREKDVTETDLLPSRIKSADRKPATKKPVKVAAPKAKAAEPAPKVTPVTKPASKLSALLPKAAVTPKPAPVPSPSAQDADDLRDALKALEAIKLKMSDFRKAASE